MKKDSRQTTLMANDLTLRGLFAKDALVGLLSSGYDANYSKRDALVTASFDIADKMIERLKEPGPDITNNIARVIPESDLKYFAKLNAKNQ